MLMSRAQTKNLTLSLIRLEPLRTHRNSKRRETHQTVTALQLKPTIERPRKCETVARSNSAPHSKSTGRMKMTMMTSRKDTIQEGASAMRSWKRGTTELSRWSTSNRGSRTMGKTVRIRYRRAVTAMTILHRLLPP